MAGLLFSIIISVSIVTVVVFAARRQIVRRYGYKVLYMLSFILALRLIIPYSVQIPNVPRLNIVIPRWVFVVWGVGAVLSVLYHTANYFYSRRRIMRCGKKCSDEEMLSLLEEEKQKLFIDRDIPLVISKEVGSPMLVGMLSPVIVLSSAPYAHDEYPMIFRHELLHYRNKDSIKKLFFMLVVSVCWFNPFAYLLMRESSNSLECICDEGVLKNTDTQYKQDYCMMLLKTGNSRRFIPITSNLNTKEMLKMRINSIFEKKNKRSGGMLIVSVILCLSILSSILCSCTVETPQDVLDEMERVENSVNNENEAGTFSTDYELHPVAEVIANAPSTIEEWNTKDGIFKFDNCQITLPDATEFIEYTYTYDVGIETPQRKQALFDYLEEKYFGKDYFTEEEMLYLPADQSEAVIYGGERRELTYEQFINSTEEISSIGAFTVGDERLGSMEIINGSIRIYSPYNEKLSHMFHENEDSYELFRARTTVNCADTEGMNQTVSLTDGSEVKLADAVKLAEEKMNASEYVIDDKINYKGDHVVISPQGNGTYIINIILRAYYDGVPFVELYTLGEFNVLDRSEIKAKYTALYEFCDFGMYRAGQFDSILTSLTYNKLTPTGNSITEIISAEQVLEILKDTFSNRTDYKITEFTLGNEFVSYTEREYSWERKTEDFINIPIYRITLEKTGQVLHVWIDARTGDMNYWLDYNP